MKHAAVAEPLSPVLLREPRTRERVARGLVRALSEAGVDTYFGVPGGPIISVFHQVLLEDGVRLVEPRHETGGAFAAMGYHRATGRVPGLIVTAGPGITNAVTGVAAAFAERVPMVVLCGDVAGDGRCLAQDLDVAGRGGVERIFGGITRAVRRVRRPSAALSELRAAFAAATDPRHPGPVVLVVPIDLADVEAAPPSLHAPSPPTPRAPFDPELSHVILSRIASARRPLLVVGAACRGHEAQVRALVDALGVPVMTTPQAKGLVPETHPASLRGGGMSASFWARRYCAEGPDVALVLGTDLDDTSTAGTPVVGDEGEVIHVDVDPTVFGRNFPTWLGVEATLAHAAEGLVAAAAERGELPRETARLMGEAKERSPFDEPGFREDDASPIAPHRVIADLERAARPSDRFVTDIGEHMLFALHYLTSDTPDRFTIHLGLGSMGSGIGSAIGLALGDPSRRVICVCGDGGMQMNGAEILVARAHRLPIVYAIFNDARYNMVFHGYRLTHGREEPWATGRMDFVRWAEAHGVAGHRVEHPGEITTELLDTLTAAGPAVLDIRQDRDRRIRGDGRIEALRQMSFGDEGSEA